MNARREELADAAMQAKLTAEAVDVTLPGRRIARGGIHPVIRTWMRIEEIFASIGFDVADGPEIESDCIASLRLTIRRTILLAPCKTPSMWIVAMKRECNCLASAYLADAGALCPDPHASDQGNCTGTYVSC